MIQRRRLVVGAFVLEASRPHRSTRRWPAARGLIEWACREIRKSTPGTPGERAWFLSSIALVEEARDWAFLWRVPETVLHTEFGKRTVEEHGSDVEHLAHVRARLPQEPRVMLAEILAHEQDTWRAGTLLRGPAVHRGPLGDRLFPGDYERYLEGLVIPEPQPGRPESYRSAERRAELNRLSTLKAVEQAYQKLASDETVRAEAWLRSGYVLFRLGKNQAALERLGQVRRLAPEPFLAYLSEYLSAWILEQSKQWHDAIDAYRRALAAVPRAPSSVTRLAALLFQMNLRTEADRLFSEGTSAPVADPIPYFFLGDARLWPQFLDDLRARLR